MRVIIDTPTQYRHIYSIQTHLLSTDTLTQYRHTYSVYVTNLFIKVDTLLNNCLKCCVGWLALNGEKLSFLQPFTSW